MRRVLFSAGRPPSLPGLRCENSIRFQYPSISSEQWKGRFSRRPLTNFGSPWLWQRFCSFCEDNKSASADNRISVQANNRLPAVNINLFRTRCPPDQRSHCLPPSTNQTDFPSCCWNSDYSPICCSYLLNLRKTFKFSQHKNTLSNIYCSKKNDKKVHQHVSTICNRAQQSPCLTFRHCSSYSSALGLTT